VDEEASQELVCRDNHDLLLATASVVLPEEGDALFLERQETMVGDGDAVSVAGQIVENVFRSTEGLLGIDNPLLGEELAQELAEALRSGKLLERAVNLPRKTRLRTRTGRKNRGDAAIQPVPSIASPPAGTTQ
jgi:hypothetical protein